MVIFYKALYFLLDLHCKSLINKQIKCLTKVIQIKGGSIVDGYFNCQTRVAVPMTTLLHLVVHIYTHVGLFNYIKHMSPCKWTHSKTFNSCHRQTCRQLLSVYFPIKHLYMYHKLERKMLFKQVCRSNFYISLFIFYVITMCTNKEGTHVFVNGVCVIQATFVCTQELFLKTIQYWPTLGTKILVTFYI